MMLNNAHCGDVDDDEDDDEDDEGTSTVYKVTQVPKTRTHSCHTHSTGKQNVYFPQERVR